MKKSFVFSRQFLAFQTGFPRKGLLQAEKSHKKALGDVKNTFYNTPMGAIPKTPFQGRVKPFEVTPTNVDDGTSLRSNMKGSRAISPIGKKPKSKRVSRKAALPFEPESINYYDQLPESVFQCQDRSVAEIWAENLCPMDDEISKLIEMTLDHQPPDIAPTYIPYTDDELMMPPPSPTNTADFSFEAPQIGESLMFDLINVAFTKMDM